MDALLLSEFILLFFFNKFCGWLLDYSNFECDNNADVVINLCAMQTCYFQTGLIYVLITMHKHKLIPIMRSQLKNERGKLFLPHRDLNHGPL